MAMPSYAQVNEWLYVGNKLSCNDVKVDVCLHINRSDRPDKDCGRHKHGYDWHLDYKDGDVLTEDHFTVLDAIVAELRPPAQLRGEWPKFSMLVHCNAGGCRSPLIAAYLWAMVDREIDPLEALSQVEKSIYHQRHKFCNIVYTPKAQVLQLIQKDRGGPIYTF